MQVWGTVRQTSDSSVYLPLNYSDVVQFSWRGVAV
jgi:hypothetical protein